MVTFEKTIINSDIQWNILTYSTEYSNLFPDNGQEVIVIDSDGEKYKKKIDNGNPRINSFGELYKKYNVKVGDKITVNVDFNDIGEIYVEFENTELAEEKDKDDEKQNSKRKLPLTKNEINVLSEKIKKLKSYIDNNLLENDKNEVVRYIQYPKIPSMLSESLVMHLINDKKILAEKNITDCQLGGGADIIGMKKEENDIRKKNIKIEVKATTADFQQLGKRDVNAHFLIWVDMKKVFRENKDTFDIYIVEPKDTTLKAERMTLTQFKKKIQKEKADYIGDFKKYLLGKK